MEIYEPRLNHLINPIGYEISDLMFSWKVRNTLSVKQKSARIRIATDEKMVNLLFDSGNDENASSIGYHVDLDLVPRKRYYWTVEVKSCEGESAISSVQFFETGKMDERWIGKWITCDKEEKRHPYFVKEIGSRENVAKARLYICGLGLYTAYFDDKKVGEEYLTPYQNNYTRWVQYQTYDITKEVKLGGSLRVLLGNGWYKGRFGFKAHEDKGYYGDEFKLIAEVVISYEDGTEEVIGTDESWMVERSQITFSSIYDGEHFDATLPKLQREQVHICRQEETPVARYSLPVIEHEIMKPIALIHTPKDELVFDLGQNFAGIFELKVKEAKGTRVHIQTGEVLQNGCFYNENLRTAKSEYIYICGGEEEIIKPHFTFYGYRYVKVSGVTKLNADDFTGIALYSDLSFTGDIQTGHELVNKLVSNVRWGMKGNFVDVPTDCPQRDERMGWTGDTQVFSSTATFFGDTFAFYRKYLHDMYTEQLDLDGKVPDVVPSAGIHSTACVWGDAACIIPWNLYKFYGDITILKEQYDSMKSWVEYIKKVDGDNHGWRDVFHYGDWLALDNPSGKIDDVFGGTEEGYIANVYYAASADILAKTAKILGNESDFVKYSELSEKQFAEVKKEYFSQTGRCCIKTQTGLILALKYHLSDDEELTKKMLRKLFEAKNDKLQTGFVGMPLMCPVLSDNGMNDLAYKLLLNEEYPGWLHEILLGATTVWERWNSLDEDGNISSTGMNSLNHYSYGSIVEWLYSYVLGFRVNENNPGNKELLICPSYNWELRSARGNFESTAGNYTVAWKFVDSKHVNLKVSIPFDARARIVLWEAPKKTFEDSGNPLFRDVREGICYVESGDYEVTYELNQIGF